MTGTADEWADVPRVPQDDGHAPVVTIAYPKAFEEAMDLFRGVVRLGEQSERALRLTTRVLRLNPANYSVWHYRRQCLEATGADLVQESLFVRDMALASPKNYQLWQHRRWLVQRCEEAQEELQITAEVLHDDPKNYHAWTHRQWALNTFGGWELELEYCDHLLDQDVLNNSAWNQWFFVLEHQGITRNSALEQLQRACVRIEQDPTNQAAWNFISGLAFALDFDESVCSSIIDRIQSMPQHTTCIPALAVLVDLLERTSPLDSIAYMEQLRAIDTIRADYWSFRRSQSFAAVDAQ